MDSVAAAEAAPTSDSPTEESELIKATASSMQSPNSQLRSSVNEKRLLVKLIKATNLTSTFVLHYGSLKLN